MDGAASVVLNPLAVQAAALKQLPPTLAHYGVKEKPKDKSGKELTTKFNATDRFFNLQLCPPYRSLDTEFRDGNVVMDRNCCCGLGSVGREVAALRNMSSWRTQSSHTFSPKCGDGTISVRVGYRTVNNRFTPSVMSDGWTEAHKVDAALRYQANADTQTPPWVRGMEQRSFSNRVGCLGSTSGCCNCWPLCSTSAQTLKIGPDDELSLSKENVCCFTKEVDNTGATLSKVDYIAASVPVGLCGRTNETCDPLRCTCGCAEVVTLGLGHLPEATVDVWVPSKQSAEVVREIAARVMHPALGVPVPVREYGSSTFCCGSQGSMIVTQANVVVRRTAYPSGCCCCWLCQTSKTITQPMDKIMAVGVESEGCLYAVEQASQQLYWASIITLDNVRMGNILGAVFGLITLMLPALLYVMASPVVAAMCCCCQLQEVRLKGNAPDIVFKVRAPLDTAGLGIQLFAEDVVNLFRQIQDKNTVLIAAYETGLAKTAADAVVAVAAAAPQQGLASPQPAASVALTAAAGQQLASPQPQPQALPAPMLQPQPMQQAASVISQPPAAPLLVQSPQSQMQPLSPAPLQQPQLQPQLQQDAPQTPQAFSSGMGTSSRSAFPPVMLMPATEQLAVEPQQTPAQPALASPEPQQGVEKEVEVVTNPFAQAATAPS